LAVNLEMIPVFVTFSILTGGIKCQSPPPTALVIQKYMSATVAQQAVLQAATTEVEISVRIPKLEKEGRLRALRRISPAGEVSYQVLDVSGDTIIQREVITRYLTADAGVTQAAATVSPANYVFRFKARMELFGRRVSIYRLTPKKKKRNLFKGELWLDEETGMPVREAGQFVKNSSIVIKSIRFVREYKIQAGVALPDRITSTIETRLAGRVELNVQFADPTTGYSSEGASQ
jgi:hypothetical protein